MSPRLLLGIAAAVVCAGVVGLWLMIDSAPSSAGTSAAPPPRDPPPAPAPAAIAADPAPSRNRTATLPAAPAAPSHAPAPEASTPDPPVVGGEVVRDPAIERHGRTRKLIKAQVVMSEPQLAECLEKAGMAGKVEGMVSFPFTVSRQAGKIVVDATAEITTVTDRGLVECMRAVTQAMKFDELPEGVDSITSYRKVTVKDGAIVENWMGPHTTTPPGY